MPDEFTITVEPQLIATTLPEHLIRQLEAAWAERRPVSFVNSLPAWQAFEAGFPLLDFIEQGLVEQGDRELRKIGRTLLSSSGLVWTRRPITHPRTDPELRRRWDEHPWERGGDYLPGDELVCRITGVSIPLIEETDRG